jgi:hypothetical protein
LDSSRFYSALQVITEFEAVTRAESYAELPADWHVAFCDVRNSTAAVAAGKYRNVNSIGAAAITAVINAAQGVDIPFSFEGDGAVNGLVLGVTLFLGSCLQVFGFGSGAALLVAFVLSVATAGALWRQLSQLMLQVQEGNFRAVDFDNFDQFF